jgi:hypothetical protein
MPFYRDRYPKSWTWISKRIRERANHRCEFCGAKNYEPHPITGSQVVLTVAHLDHDPMNCDGMESVEDIYSVPLLPFGKSNLAAACQRCHLTYDAKHHAQNAATTRHNKKLDAGQMEMFPRRTNYV